MSISDKTKSEEARKIIRPQTNGLIILKMILLTITSVNNLMAQDINYSVHANIIYHFTKYIDWPEDNKSGAFIIGIIGDSPLFDELTRITANKTAGAQKIIVKKYSINDYYAGCHILFVSEDEYRSTKKIAANTEGMSILIVTEVEGLASIGSCINFIIEDDRLKLEINRSNIENRKLKIASELLTLGKVIQ